LVNVHIRQFQPGGAVVDAAALGQFQEQWGTYRKLVESDCLAHRQVGGILHEALKGAFTSPFCFLDIACGDASMMASALRGTKVRHYHGIDMSQPALELAAANLAALPCEVDLDHRDFVEAMLRRPEHADAAWCSLSVHHLATDDKLKLMKAIRSAIGEAWAVHALRAGPSGRREPSSMARPLRTDERAVVERIDAGRMGPDLHHVLTCDFPETAAVCVRARPRGGAFAEATQVFVDPTDFFRLFRYEA